MPDNRKDFLKLVVLTDSDRFCSHALLHWPERVRFTEDGGPIRL